MSGYNDTLDRAITANPACLMGGRKSDLTRIWLVDDNPSFRTLLAALLAEEAGFNCERQFSSPPEILDALSHELAPDVILLDIEMGAHNGLDAIRPLKSVAPETHVLMLTTFAGPGSRERAFREGASDFMLKTWSTPEIAARIWQAMEFGTVAGLMTAFFSSGEPAREMAKVEPVKMAVRASRAERWFANLRGLLKFSTS